MTRFILVLPILFLSPLSHAKCRAVLVNGGFSPAANYSIHEKQMKEMYNSLVAQGCKADDIFVFSASGSTTNKDYRVNPVTTDTDFRASDYKYDGKSVVKNLFAADKATLKSKMTEISQKSAPGDKLFIYMSDHGNNSETGGKGLVPWTNDPNGLFTEKDLSEVLAAAPAKTQVNVWADCCYCGVYNKVQRANTCVSTSTDEFHPGKYFWTNPEFLTDRKQHQNAAKASVHAPFAEALKAQGKKSTLGNLAKPAQLALNDEVYVESAISGGCFLGPRNSADQYLFEVIGYGDKQLCEEDLNKIFDIKATEAGAGCIDCSPPSAEFPEVERFENLTEIMEKVSTKTSGASKARIQKLVAEMKSVIQKIENSPELASATELLKDFSKMSEDERRMSLIDYQSMAEEARLKALDKYKVVETFSKNQKMILEEIFKIKATPEQKENYERRKACLSSALF